MNYLCCRSRVIAAYRCASKTRVLTLFAVCDALCNDVLALLISTNRVLAFWIAGYVLVSR